MYRVCTVYRVFFTFFCVVHSLPTISRTDDCRPNCSPLFYRQLIAAANFTLNKVRNVFPPKNWGHRHFNQVDRLKEESFNQNANHFQSVFEFNGFCCLSVLHYKTSVQYVNWNRMEKSKMEENWREKWGASSIGKKAAPAQRQSLLVYRLSIWLRHFRPIIRSSALAALFTIYSLYSVCVCMCVDELSSDLTTPQTLVNNFPPLRFILTAWKQLFSTPSIFYSR